MPSVTEEGLVRLNGLENKNSVQEFDARVFAAANYTGPSIRLLQPERQFSVIDEILVTLALLNSSDAPSPQAIGLIVEAIIDNYGHLRPEEIKLALTGSLMGKIEGAPKTYQKMNLEWIGGVLSVYDDLRGACITRTRSRLPKLEDKSGERSREEVEEAFFELVVRCVNEDSLPNEALSILPEIFIELEKWVKENLSGTLLICNKRRMAIYNQAQDIIKKKDERATKYEATKNDFFNATMLSIRKDKTKETRAVRLSREMACRELIGYLKKYQIKIPYQKKNELCQLQKQ